MLSGWQNKWSQSLDFTKKTLPSNSLLLAGNFGAWGFGALVTHGMKLEDHCGAKRPGVVDVVWVTYDGMWAGYSDMAPHLCPITEGWQLFTTASIIIQARSCVGSSTALPSRPLSASSATLWFTSSLDSTSRSWPTAPASGKPGSYCRSLRG